MKAELRPARAPAGALQATIAYCVESSWPHPIINVILDAGLRSVRDPSARSPCACWLGRSPRSQTAVHASCAPLQAGRCHQTQCVKAVFRCAGGHPTRIIQGQSYPLSCAKTGGWLPLVHAAALLPYFGENDIQQLRPQHKCFAMPSRAHLVTRHHVLCVCTACA